MTLLLISFVAGVLTVLAPCVLPLLPVIVGGSMEGGSASRRRAFVIVASLGVSLILFTLLLKASTVLIGVPESFWKWVSGLIIIAFGATLLFPAMWERLPLAGSISRGSNRLMAAGFQRGGFWGDVIMGAALGPVFSACSPTYFVLLASVLPVSFALGVAYLGVFVLGLCLSLLLIALLGQRVADRLGWAADPRGTFKRALGALFILVGLAVVSGLDKDIQIWVLDTGFLDVTRVEQKLLEMQ
ncbi:cytochrome C biogenesis protein [Candidatus Kaiserbacteria bacterium RIFCSPHIGHO2_02_FULL_59_21]|uniref:Cytochrome C biogenesis protein n=1 Tax=Candidatus Kaiserbacteria bacterium RIFCSPHIGHO2_02_FULL_59_21 TaxID=1798500 RepID=A0A1F6E188_9BACT|nr:MAG: cytochrome C biogenesis protein [Candidatus Kaiserbacteria bacterium RIFCSPHIGHO2_01_FULL_58_22]OGG67433.1 MAG: cytochrome C biogenesis protein [Candidatus Kaiserbacteria bacterium RIFCSPHIGHO2_02_FULL_59_21]OGG80694.1 MAG: cytochrome C biogenesis protein [Candidatus Kaiserbacteria bacterium RIFCSPLOWO2_01_FULL_59_34]OGG85809.1 MAG: cytochrome C biogenesis protein [Candidatus Kaiserbacteria bacterium RIFCSPLOWO2_02_FULL_59_19]